MEHNVTLKVTQCLGLSLQKKKYIKTCLRADKAQGEIQSFAMLKVVLFFGLLIGSIQAQSYDSCEECLEEWNNFDDMVHEHPWQTYLLMKMVNCFSLI